MHGHKDLNSMNVSRIPKSLKCELPIFCRKNTLKETHGLHVGGEDGVLSRPVERWI
jgi:hypothetical protein